MKHGCLDVQCGSRNISAPKSISGPKNAGECVSAKGPKDTFDGSAQGKSPCEVDINEGLQEGRV